MQFNAFVFHHTGHHNNFSLSQKCEILLSCGSQYSLLSNYYCEVEQKLSTLLSIYIKRTFKVGRLLLSCKIHLTLILLALRAPEWWLDQLAPRWPHAFRQHISQLWIFYLPGSCGSTPDHSPKRNLFTPFWLCPINSWWPRECVSVHSCVNRLLNQIVHLCQNITVEISYQIFELKRKNNALYGANWLRALGQELLHFLQHGAELKIQPILTIISPTQSQMIFYSDASYYPTTSQ